MRTAFKLARAHFKLDFPKPMLIMLLMSVTMLAPNYPRIVVIMFFIMMMGSLLSVVRETRSEDMFLTLPIRRRDVVGGQTVYIVCIQTLYLLCCTVTAVVSMFIPFFGKTIATYQPGILANVAFFGISLAVYGAFNLVFLPLYYRKGSNVSAASLTIACLVGILVAILTYGIFETLAQTVPPIGKILLNFDVETLPWQFLFLIGGAALYAALTFFGTRLAEKRYMRGN